MAVLIDDNFSSAQPCVTLQNLNLGADLFPMMITVTVWVPQ